MPYTKSNYDIFLSYRHIDNQKLTTEQDGWVSRLHKDIAARVSQYLGSEVAMWRDPRLQGNDYFGETIERALLDVAVLISIVTPGYQRSDWCRRELAVFIAAAEKQGGIRLGTKSRLFKVLKTPTPLHEQPLALQNLLGYAFFHDGKEFHLDPDPILAERRYLAKLDDLARDIHLLLKDLARGTSNQQSKSQTNKVVYPRGLHRISKTAATKSGESCWIVTWWCYLRRIRQCEQSHSRTRCVTLYNNVSYPSIRSAAASESCPKETTALSRGYSMTWRRNSIGRELSGGFYGCQQIS